MGSTRHVAKSLTIKSTSGNPADTIVQAANPNDHVFEVTADYVNIYGFKVKGANEDDMAGILLNYADYCNISNNNVNSNTIGMGLWHSLNNLIGNNYINSNYFGIYVDTSINNVISNNTFVKNGLFVEAYKNIVKDNTVNGKPLVYLEEASNYKIADAGQIILVNCNNITVENQDLSNTDVGIELLGTNNSKIISNTINSNSYYGIVLSSYSSNNLLISNNVSNNYGFGIALLGYSCSNTLISNNVSNNWYGIYLLSSSSNNMIASNNANSNNVTGILLGHSSNNTIRNNIANSNNYFGIHLSSSSSSNIITNNIASNNQKGMFLHISSSNNKIYLNNFVNNADNVHSYDSTNIWNSTAKITYTYKGNTYTNYLGNYWDDYKEQYPDAGEIDETGIWNAPYSIYGDNDNYPLMERFENYFGGKKSFIIRNETTIIENEVTLGDVITLDASSISGKDYNWKIAYQPIGPTVEKTGSVAQYWIRYLGKINIDLTVADEDGKKTTYSRIIGAKPISPYSDDQSVEFRIINKPQCDYKTEVLITERVPILVSKYSNENEGINANIFQIGPASKEVEEWLLKKGVTEAAIKIIEKVTEKSISSVFLPLTTLLDIINLYDTWMQGDLVLVQHTTTTDGTVYHIHVPIRRASFEGSLDLPPDQTQPSDEWVRQKIKEDVIKKAENNGKIDWKEADISKIALINQSIGLEGDYHYRYEKAIKPGYNGIEFRYEPLKQQWDNVIYPPHAIIKVCAKRRVYVGYWTYEIIPLKDIPIYIDNSLYRKTDRFGIVRVDMTSISPGKHTIKVGDDVVFEGVTKEVNLETGKELKISVNFDKIDQYKYKHCIYALVHFYSPEESPFGYSVRNYIINEGKASKTVFSRPSSDLDLIEKYAGVSNLNVYIGTDFTWSADRSKEELIIENEEFKILRYPKITKNSPGWVFTILIKNPDKLKESNAMEHAIEYFITNFDSLSDWQKLEQLEAANYTNVFNCSVNTTITKQYNTIISGNNSGHAVFTKASTLNPSK